MFLEQNSIKNSFIKSRSNGTGFKYEHFKIKYSESGIDETLNGSRSKGLV